MSMPDSSVRYYDSTMVGAPTLSNVAGTLIGVLDACLVDGFGSVTLDSLVVAGDVATATYSTGHGFAMIGNTGPVIRISGASPPALNGDWRVTVTSGTAFTFATTGIDNQTATGTISAKRAPAGFEKAFTGTSLAAYRSLDIESTRCYLRVDDTPNYSAAAVGYESMSDIDTGAGAFPATSNYGIGRSLSTDSTARPWVLIADGRLFYLHVDYNSGGFYFTMAAFGDALSNLTTDAYHCVLARSAGGAGGTTLSQGGTNSGLFNRNTATIALPRSYTQIGVAITAFLESTFVTTWGNSSIAYPDAVANQFIAAPILLFETTARFRGMMPGMYAPLNNFTSAIHKTVISAIPALPGRELILLAGQNAGGAVAFDLTGPWR
jgi:hypothetical protein